MADARLSELVSDFDKERELGLSIDREREQIRRTAEASRLAWFKAYGTLPDSFEEASLPETVKRLRAVAVLILDRFWDFRIAKMLARTDLTRSFEAAAIILKYACIGDDKEVLECLRSAKKLMYHIETAHGDLLDIFRAEDSGWHPATPPLSQAEMARVMGVSYDVFRGQLQAGDWAEIGGVPKKHRRFRCWRNFNAAEQAAVLIKIRDKFPHKIWRSKVK